MSLSVEVDTISPTPSGLVLGCVVRYSEQGPVRFVRAVVPWRLFGMGDMQEVMTAFDRLLDVEPDDAPLF